MGDDREGGPDGSASVTLSADGKTLALGYWDYTIRLWDVASGKPLRKLTGYPDRFYPAYRLAFSPDGKVLAAAGSYHAVCLLDVATGKQLHKDAPAHKSNVRAVAVSPDGSLVASASHDQTVCLWEAATGRPLHQLRGHDGWVYAVAFAPDGRTVASGSSDGTVRVWDTTTGREVRKLRVGKGRQDVPGRLLQVFRVAFSPDGKVLAASYNGGAKWAASGICLWDTTTGKELRHLPGPTGSGGCLAFSPDSRTLLAAGDDHLHRWQVATGKEVSRVVNPVDPSGEIALSPDTTLAAANRHDGLVLVWEVNTGRHLLAIRKAAAAPLIPVFSPDGRYLALCGANYVPPGQSGVPAVGLWELASGQAVCRYRLPPRTGVSSAAFTSDSRRLATGMGDTTVLVWDLAPAPPPKEMGRLEESWATLADPDAARAWRAMTALRATPRKTMTFLKEHLRAAEVDQRRIQELIADLDSDQLPVRERATRELAEMGDAARPLLEQARTASSPEVRRRAAQLLEGLNGPVLSPRVLRDIRAVATLEYVGTPEARQLLESLAKGAPEAQLTREAKASLERLARRQVPVP